MQIGARKKHARKSSVAAVNGVGNRGVCHATAAQPGRGESGECRPRTTIELKEGVGEVGEKGEGGEEPCKLALSLSS